MTSTPTVAERSAPARRAAGQSLVEFAIFLPLLMVILLTVVDLGRAYLGWISLNNVARIGANFAAQNPDAWQDGNTTVQTRYRQLMANDATQINCTLPTPLPAPQFIDSSYSVGARVKVEIDCGFRLVTPFLSNIVGDVEGNLNVRSSAVFTIRFGSPNGAPIQGTSPTPGLTPSPAPTASPTVSPTPTPLPSGATPGPSASPTPTPFLVVSFYGSPTSSDSSGGGPPGSIDENLIVGIPSLAVTFYNTTTGTQGNCQWQFGDGGTSTACSGTVSYTYTTRATYSVTLTVDGQTVSRSNYVLSGCKVPAFAGVRKNSASATWTAAGFASANLSTSPGTGNYKIGYQSVAGGLVNPPGGCAGATIQVGP